MKMKCFACNKPIPTGKAKIVITEDGQRVEVGPNCYGKIKKAEKGYKPILGGPTLFLIDTE